MAYKFIPDEKIKHYGKETPILSDGKRWYEATKFDTKIGHETIIRELERMTIDSDKTLLILNPMLFQDNLYYNLYAECQVSLIAKAKDDNDKKKALYLKKTKIRHPYPNNSYLQCTMKKGNSVCRMGQVFVFDSINELRLSCGEIQFLWTVRSKKDGKFVYGAKTIIEPQFIPKDSTESNWFYLENIDAWYSKKNGRDDQTLNFPTYQGKEVTLPHYDSEKATQEENFLDDIEEVLTQKLSLSLFSDDSFWDICSK